MTTMMMADTATPGKSFFESRDEDDVDDDDDDDDDDDNVDYDNDEDEDDDDDANDDNDDEDTNVDDNDEDDDEEDDGDLSRAGFGNLYSKQHIQTLQLLRDIFSHVDIFCIQNFRSCAKH